MVKIKFELIDELKTAVKNTASEAAVEYYRQNGILNTPAPWYEKGKAALSRELERKMLIAINNAIADVFEDLNVG